jgi:hypothetical protein
MKRWLAAAIMLATLVGVLAYVGSLGRLMG